MRCCGSFDVCVCVCVRQSGDGGRFVREHKNLKQEFVFLSSFEFHARQQQQQQLRGCKAARPRLIIQQFPPDLCHFMFAFISAAAAVM